MRQAAFDCVTTDDLKEIVKSQIARAKNGDQGAIKFVFDNLLGGGMKGATFIQNNNYGGEEAAKPTDAIPGTKKKLEVIRRRVESGMPACDRGDRAGVNLD